jgi:hypothetical protein
MQSNSFYEEANDMSEGWGDTLRSIDVLRAKFDSNEDITIKDACFILWAEKCVDSHVYLKFKDDMKSYKRRKMPWPAWYGMFEDWNKR